MWLFQMFGQNSGPVFTLLCFDFCTLAKQGFLWVIIILNIFSGLDMPPTLSFHNHHILLLIFILKFLLYVCLCQRVVFDSLRPHGLQPTRVLYPWNSPGKYTGMGCHSLLQGIFPTQRANPRPLHCRESLYHLSPLGKPIITLYEVFVTAECPFLSNVI